MAILYAILKIAEKSACRPLINAYELIFSDKYSSCSCADLVLVIMPMGYTSKITS